MEFLIINNAVFYLIMCFCKNYICAFLMCIYTYGICFKVGEEVVFSFSMSFHYIIVFILYLVLVCVL